MSDDRLRSLEVAFATLSATVSTKLDTLIATTSKVSDDHEKRIRAVEDRAVPDPTLEDRVAALEKRVWTAAGWITGVGVVLNVALTVALAVFL